MHAVKDIHNLDLVNKIKWNTWNSNFRYARKLYFDDAPGYQSPDRKYWWARIDTLPNLNSTVHSKFETHFASPKLSYWFFSKFQIKKKTLLVSSFGGWLTWTELVCWCSTKTIWVDEPKVGVSGSRIIAVTKRYWKDATISHRLILLPKLPSHDGNTFSDLKTSKFGQSHRCQVTGLLKIPLAVGWHCILTTGRQECCTYSRWLINQQLTPYSFTPCQAVPAPPTQPPHNRTGANAI